MANRFDGIEEGMSRRREEGVTVANSKLESDSNSCGCTKEFLIPLGQKLLAEVIGTFMIMFTGFGAIIGNKMYGQHITGPGVSVCWGLIVMVMIYTVGHISGAHFNPGVSITFALFGRFPWREVPFFIVAQLVGSTLASGIMALLVEMTPEAYFGTVPAGSNLQSFVIEVIIAFLLMFVIFGAAQDDRGIGELGGIAVGMTICLNSLAFGPISGASLNPARSIGPAIVKHIYKGLWIYIFAPVIGMIAGGFAYNLVRLEKPLDPVKPTSAIFKSSCRN